MIDKTKEVDKKVADWILDVREGKCKGDEVTVQTVLLMKKVVSSGGWKNAQELIGKIKAVGRTLERRYVCDNTTLEPTWLKGLFVGNPHWG